MPSSGGEGAPKTFREAHRPRGAGRAGYIACTSPVCPDEVSR